MTFPIWPHWFLDDLDFAGRGRRGAPPPPPGGRGGPPPPGSPPGPPPWGMPPGGPWGGWLGQLFGRPPRVPRGNVRAAILSLLAEGPRNGYQIMQELKARSHGEWRPSSGSVYPTLSQLEDEGLIEGSAIAGGGRSFRITKAGEDYVKKHGPELQAAWDTGSSAETGDMRLELMTLFKNIASAAMQVFQHGTSEQVAQAKRLLDNTRRGLYRILADDPPDENDD